MFEPEFSKYSWAPELAAAAARGPDDAKRFARRVREQLTDEEADAVGEEFVRLMADEPPDVIASLTAAATPFAGPKTIARVGALLRVTREDWQIERCLEILQDNPSPAAAFQQLLCARDAKDSRVMERTASMFRFSRMLVSKIASAAGVDAPPEDRERFFSLALERAMLEGTRFRAADLELTLADSATSLLRRVVWAHYEGRRVQDVFMVDPEDASLVNVDWEPVSLPSGALVGVVHPAEIKPEHLHQWGLTLADSEVVGLFAQLDRGHETATRDFPYMKIERAVEAPALVHFLHREGWSRGHGSHTFEYRIRGSALQLDVSGAAELWMMENLSLARPRLDRDSREDDIIYNEALTASVALLEEFAPDLI